MQLTTALLKEYGFVKDNTYYRLNSKNLPLEKWEYKDMVIIVVHTEARPVFSIADKENLNVVYILRSKEDLEYYLSAKGKGYTNNAIISDLLHKNHLNLQDSKTLDNFLKHNLN